MGEFFTNPIIKHGDDPFVTKYGGYYYYCYSTGNGVNVTRADKIQNIRPSENGGAVYTAPCGTAWSCEYWAPELHRIDGRWYIYVAADDGSNDNHRMYVLGALTDDPCGKYEMIGKISVMSPYDKWAIDGTVVKIGDADYFVWSGWSGDLNLQQNLYIARMKNAHTLEGERSLISCPEFDWEMKSCGGGLPSINEGPAALYHDGRIFMVYSASGSWSDDYCLGMLEYKGGDPLDPRSWKKYEKPVFSADEGSYGPGHCSFTKSPDGSEDYIIYHANSVKGSSWGGRSVRMQKIFWDNGVPMFGKPAVPGEMLPVPSESRAKPDTLLFDLDGTLVPMTQDDFVKIYLGLMCKKLGEYGFEPKRVTDTIWKGFRAMSKNGGNTSNREVFDKIAKEEFGERSEEFINLLFDFYKAEFNGAKSAVRYDMIESGSFDTASLVKKLREKGYSLVLATNPVFPRAALEARLAWVGLSADDFIYITDYENSRFCKPTKEYFDGILKAIGKSPENCIMFGNNVAEDMGAEKSGIKSFLVTDFLMNPENADVGAYAHGKFREIGDFLDE